MDKKSSIENNKMTPKFAALVGGLAGIIDITCGYPIKFAKVIMLLKRKYNKLGTMNVMRRTLRKKGFFGLYRGYNLMLMASVPKAYVRFGTYQYLQQNIFTYNMVNTTICGAIAGAVEGLFIHTPVENLKVKLIHDMFKEKPKYKSVFHGVYRVGKDKGFKGISSGVAITCMKERCNQAIRFPLFMAFQNVFSPYIDNTIFRDLVAGSMTGIL